MLNNGEGGLLPFLSLKSKACLMKCSNVILWPIITKNKGTYMANVYISAISVMLFIFVLFAVASCDSASHNNHVDHSAHSAQMPRTQVASTKAVPVSTSWSMSQVGRSGLFKANFHCDAIPSVGDFQSCGLTVTQSGEPVHGAKIAIDGGMKAHGHGLPTKPQIKSTAAAGEYQIEGLKFSMPGAWTVGFKIDAADTSDQVIFDFTI
jgi:hypothetical protein